MCGRFSIFGPVKMTRVQRDVAEQLGFDLVSEINQRDQHYKVAPTQKALVVARTVHCDTKAGMLRWGLVPTWAKETKIGAKLINARVESVLTKPSFRTGFKKRRCLVLASGYFEWRVEAGGKQPYFIHDPEGDLLLFAGLWEIWREQLDDLWLQTFTIVSGEPGNVSGDIHDQQPLVLLPDLWPVWLEGEPEEAAAMLHVVPEAEVTYYPVPKPVGSPRNQGPELVEPITR